MSWVMSGRVIDLFAYWWKSGRPMSAAIWKMVPICIIYCVWKERNLRCFKDLNSSIEDILASFFHTLYLWTMIFLSPLSISYADFLVFFFFFDKKKVTEESKRGQGCTGGTALVCFSIPS
jgi:hypothetical protein